MSCTHCNVHTKLIALCGSKSNNLPKKVAAAKRFLYNNNTNTHIRHVLIHGEFLINLSHPAIAYIDTRKKEGKRKNQQIIKIKHYLKHLALSSWPRTKIENSVLGYILLWMVSFSLRLIGFRLSVLRSNSLTMFATFIRSFRTKNE